MKILVIVLLLAGLMGCSVTASEQPGFEVTMNGEHVVETAVTTNTALFNISSQTGIGSAEVKLVHGQMPETILFQMYLNGLEEFTFAYDNTVITTSVSSTGEHTVLQTVTQAGETQTVTEDSDFYMPIRVETNYFEIEVPPDFHAGGYDDFAISWIDFYR